MTSLRAVHLAAKRALGDDFFTQWTERAPYAAFDATFLAAVRALSSWPAPEHYDELARAVSPAEELPRFVRQAKAALEVQGGYEPHVSRLRAVPTRDKSWHDFFNMAVWAHFPRVRWALNAVHVADPGHDRDPRNGRSPQQSAAAQFDESGMVVVSSSPELLAELRGLRFKRVFWERRAELLATTRFWPIGHGTLESLLTPHLGLASKAVLVEVPAPPRDPHEASELRREIDARVARQIEAWRGGVPSFAPVPVLGIPDYADNDAAEFYDDARYFRFERRKHAVDRR